MYATPIIFGLGEQESFSYSKAADATDELLLVEE